MCTVLDLVLYKEPLVMFHLGRTSGAGEGEGKENKKKDEEDEATMDEGGERG